MEIGIFLAIIGIGLTFFIWGYDKLSEVYKIKKLQKKAVGFFYFFMGIFLIAFALIVDYLV